MFLNGARKFWMVSEVVDMIKCNMGLGQGRGLVMLSFFCGRLCEKFGANFLFLLTWKKLLIGPQGNVFAFLWGVRVSQNIWWIKLCLLIKVVKLLSKLMGNYQIHFLCSFCVKVGVYQGSALSPLLFIMVMDVLTEDVRDGSLMELLYANDLVLCGESLNEILVKFGWWKMQQKKRVWAWMLIKHKVCSYYLGRKVVFWKWICMMSVEFVGCNSIQCTKCQRVHCHCSDVPRQVSLLSCCDVFFVSRETWFFVRCES